MKVCYRITDITGVHVVDEKILIEKIMGRISILLDKDDPYHELSKLIVIEYSLNPELIEQEYHEVLDQVIQKLVKFYGDTTLFELWNDYKYQLSLPRAA